MKWIVGTLIFGVIVGGAITFAGIQSELDDRPTMSEFAEANRRAANAEKVAEAALDLAEKLSETASQNATDIETLRAQLLALDVEPDVPAGGSTTSGTASSPPASPAAPPKRCTHFLLPGVTLPSIVCS